MRPHLSRAPGGGDFQRGAEFSRYDGGQNAPIYDRGFQKQDHRKKKTNFFEEPESRYNKPYGRDRNDTRDSRGSYARVNDSYHRSRSRSNPGYGNYNSYNNQGPNQSPPRDDRRSSHYRNAQNNPGSHRDYDDRDHTPPTRDYGSRGAKPFKRSIKDLYRRRQKPGNFNGPY